MLEPEKLLGKVRFDVETGLYWAEVLHLCKIEHFQGATVEDLRRMIAESLAGRGPETALSDDPVGQTFANRLILDLDPYLRLQILELAEMAGISIEEWIVTALDEAVDRSLFLEPV